MLSLKTDVIEPKIKLYWNEEAVEKLLDLRYNDFQVQFTKNKGSQQLSKYWMKITESLNSFMVSNGALDFQITPKQAQEKIGNLKKAYRAVRQKLNETGTIMLNQ